MLISRHVYSLLTVGSILLSACPAPRDPPPDRTDSDFDGVIDKRDQCRGVMETFNGFQDEDGCPDKGPTALAKVRIEASQIRTEPLKFVSGGVKLLPESLKTLDEVVTLLIENASIRIRIEGHTDNQGKDLDNLRLSNGRAYAVMAYLVEMGISQERLSASGMGATKPLDSSDSDEARARNRRVEFHIGSKG